MYSYRKATADDLKTVADLAVKLYIDHSYSEIYGEISVLLSKKSEGIWLCFTGGFPAAFAHASLRTDYVEGTSGGIIGYLEGIYVIPEYRKNNIARELIAICEDWARENGCSEFASDCPVDNTASLNFHLKTGFKEAGRIICFTKKL